MPRTLQLSQLNPTRIEEMQAAITAADPNRKLFPIGMKRIEIGSELLEQLPEIVSAFTSGQIKVVVDSTLMFRNGQDLKAFVFQTLQQHFQTEFIVLGENQTSSADHHALLHADEKTIHEAAGFILHADCVVVVGSGTIVDICKEATTRNGLQIPLIVVQTAASVNAFSDNMAVLLKDGVKRTMPSRWPDALVIDLDVIACAPAPMNIAGFGDLLAMWTAPADWYLAHLLKMNDNYHAAPGDLIRKQGKALLESAPALQGKEPEALKLLSRVLTLSGIALGVAGSTAPLSGTEHLISHLIDMSSEQTGKPLALHGAQVGISTVIVAAAWDVFLQQFNPESVRIAACFPDSGQMEPMVRKAFAVIDSSGSVGEECWQDYKNKLAQWGEKRTALEAFLNHWPIHKEQLGAILMSPETLCSGLKEAGAPVRYQDLVPPIDEATVRWALSNCYLMRNRFSLIDFLFYTGQWNDKFMDAVIQRAISAGWEF